jgi:glycosyltransferase involved in cell wall biosynthesis
MNPATVLMLLTNAYDPDPRVRQEALALIGMGYRVHLLAWDRDRKAPPAECLEGVEVERVFVTSRHGRGATQVFFYAWVYAKLLWRGLLRKFDAIHCHDLDTLPLGFILGKLKRKPIIYDAHESFPDMLEGSVPGAMLRALRVAENFLIRRIDLLITVGEKLRRHFEERGAKSSVVVGNWKRLGDFRRTPAEIAAVRNRAGVPNGALLVACITQLLPDRKLEELLQAVEEEPNVFVAIGGKGVLEARVREAAALNPRVLFLGFISGKQIADLTCAADVIYYGFDPENPNARFSAPNKLYEALAAGKPLITGDFGEIAEVVRREGCGIVLPRYGAAEIRQALSILEDARIREAMGSAASHAGATLSWEKGEQTLGREYARLLGKDVKAATRTKQLADTARGGN